MKKLFVSIMVASMALLSGNAFAQTPAQNDTKPACCATNADKADKKDKKGEPKGFKRDKLQKDPFEGLNLSADQQQRLAILREGLGPVIIPGKDSLKNVTNEQKRQIREARDNRMQESKKNYLKGVKEILNPDQYVLFLENVYIFGEPSQKPEFNKRPGMAKERLNKDRLKERKNDIKKGERKPERKDAKKEQK